MRALEDIDNIIALIKKSENATAAKEALIEKYQFTENQAKAILAMRLSSLAKLEKVELEEEKLKNNLEIERINNEIEKENKNVFCDINRITINDDIFNILNNSEYMNINHIKIYYIMIK